MRPALDWLRGYRREWAAPDVVAGLTAGAVVIPQAMAYVTVAGLPVEVGLYSCIFPMVVYALLGGSRRMSISTTSTIVALTGGALLSVGVGSDPGDAVRATTTLTLLVGVALIIGRVLRLGFLVESVSEVVLIGLKVGVGLTIACSQLPKLLGIAPADDDGFLSNVSNVVRHLGDADGTTVLLSATTLAGLVVLRRWAPRVPGPLVAVVGGIVAVALFDPSVALIPEVPRGLPTPDLPSLDHAQGLAPFALAIALMAYLESVSVARTTRAPEDPPLDNNREMFAVGATSVVGSVFQTVPAAGGFSQTLVNSEAGARTQMSELVTAALAVLTALLLAPLLSDLPQATLGALVLFAVSGLVSLTDLRRLRRIDTLEFSLGLTVTIVALLTNLLVAVAAGVAFTYYLVLHALNDPAVVELQRRAPGDEMEPARDGDQRVPGMLALRVEGGLYTANVRTAQDRLLERLAACEPTPRVLLLDVGGTANTSVTVMDAFFELDRDLARRGVTLWIAALPTRALVKARRTAQWSAWAGAGRVHATVREAVVAFEHSCSP